jgi:glutaminyl-peptide cyclotransferase
MRFFVLIFLAALALGCKTDAPPVNNTNVNVPTNVNLNSVTNTNTNVNSSKTNTKGVSISTYEVVNTYNHDPKAFTQGLFFHNGFLYESTGERGRSTLRKVEIESGKVLQKYDVPREVFAEGATLFNGKIYQITWQEEKAYLYDLETFKLLKEFNYKGEGWGLTTDGKQLIMSDGTHVIRYVDPENFETMRTITVFREDGQPLMDINELEFVRGEIWANIWHSEDINKPNHIARIDPQSGKLLGWINLDGISPDDVKAGPENTLNGIAYDAATDRIFVTGKLWKKLFEIKVKPKE